MCRGRPIPLLSPFSPQIPSFSMALKRRCTSRAPLEPKTRNPRRASVKEPRMRSCWRPALPCLPLGLRPASMTSWLQVKRAMARETGTLSLCLAKRSCAGRLVARACLWAVVHEPPKLFRFQGHLQMRDPKGAALSTCAVIELHGHLVGESPRLSLGGDAPVAGDDLGPLRPGAPALWDGAGGLGAALGCATPGGPLCPHGPAPVSPRALVGLAGAAHACRRAWGPA